MTQSTAKATITLPQPVMMLGYEVTEIDAPNPVRLSEVHRLVEVTTTYTRAGAVASVKDTATTPFSNAHSAFRALFNRAEGGRSRFTDANTSVRHDVRLHNNSPVRLFDYYAAVIGKRRFLEVLADPDFSINLETWLGEHIAKRDEVFQ